MSGSIDGIYTAQISGTHGFGLAMYVLKDGRITGADASGVTFRGSFAPNPDTGYRGIVKAIVPPNVDLIQGINSGPNGMTYDVSIELAPSGDRKHSLQLQTPFGPVNMYLTWLSEV